MHSFISSFITPTRLISLFLWCCIVSQMGRKNRRPSWKKQLAHCQVWCKERAVTKEISGALVMVTKVWPFNKTSESGGSAMCQPHLSRGRRYLLSQCPLIKTGSLPCSCVSAKLFWLMYCAFFTAWCSIMPVWYHNPFKSSKVLHLLSTLDFL